MDKSPVVLKPFIKWAGGKGQLLKEFEKLYPQHINTYYEPFLGGGAVFFALAEASRFDRAVLNDLNSELINAYMVLQNNVDQLIELLQEHKAMHSKKHYYEVRSWDVRGLSSVKMAARTIYLNKTCFNGLYRVNKTGAFNVPMGRYKNPGILEEDTLRAAHKALRNVDLRNQDFTFVVDEAESNDFVYFDPPYDPLSDTSNFTEYTSNSFDRNEQVRLAEAFWKLTEKGVKVLLSNSDTAFIRSLYRDAAQIIQLKASRAINSKASKRGAVTELAIMNY